MKILYITYVNINSKNFLGVKNKIEGQVKGLKNLGNEVDYTVCEDNNLVYYENNLEKEILYKYKNKIDKITHKYNKYLINKIIDRNIDYLYIRYSIIDYYMIRFLKSIREKNIKVFLELPTYPYDNQIGIVKKYVDILFRKRINNYVNKIIISSYEKDKIFGVDSVFIDNCIDVSMIKVREKNKKVNNKINLIGVSFIRYSNGYDRVIRGIRDYYDNGGKKEINVKFIGEGSGIKELISLVERYGLEKNIEFLGNKYGEELDNYFEEADIAISSLGDHRENIYSKAPLKAREYCARGIPFISAVKDPGFKNNEFILEFPADDTNIDIQRIIEFNNELNNNENIIDIMRNYAINNFSWENQYEKIPEFKGSKI